MYRPRWLPCWLPIPSPPSAILGVADAAPSLEASAGSFETPNFLSTGEYGSGAPDGQGEAGAVMSSLGVEGMSLQGMRAEGEAPAGEFFLPSVSFFVC